MPPDYLVLRQDAIAANPLDSLRPLSSKAEHTGYIPVVDI